MLTLLLLQVVAVGRRPGTTVHWFTMRSEKEVEDWMAGVASTLARQQGAARPPYPQ